MRKYLSQIPEKIYQLLLGKYYIKDIWKASYKCWNTYRHKHLVSNTLYNWENIDIRQGHVNNYFHYQTDDYFLD